MKYIYVFDIDNNYASFSLELLSYGLNKLQQQFKS